MKNCFEKLEQRILLTSDFPLNSTDLFVENLESVPAVTSEASPAISVSSAITVGDALSQWQALFPGQDYVVWEKDAPWDHLDRVTTPPAGVTKLQDISLDIGRNEYESTSFVITSLVDDDGGSIVFDLSYDPIAISTTLRKGIWITSLDGSEINDALSLIDGNQVSIAPGESLEIWVTLHGNDATAGQYNQTIDILPQSLAPGSVDLSVTVHDISLPEVLPLNTLYWDYVVPGWSTPALNAAKLADLKSHYVNTATVHPYIVPRYGFDKISGELIADYALFDDAIDTYEAGLAPETYMFEMLVDIYFEHTGLIDYPTASRPTFLSDAWKDGFQQWLTGWVAHMQARGMGYDQYYLSPYDERLDASVYEIAKLIKETDPQVRVHTNALGTVQEIRNIAPYVDVWTPLLNSWLAIGGVTGAMSQTVSLSPNTQYTFSFYGKNGTSTIYWDMNFNGSTSRRAEILGATDWAQETLNFTTASNTTQVTFNFYPTVGNGSIFIDDVVLVGSGPNLVINGDIEQGTASPPSGWSTYSATAVVHTTDPNSGSQSAEVTSIPQETNPGKDAIEALVFPDPGTSDPGTPDPGTNLFLTGDMENGGTAVIPPTYWSSHGTDPGQGTVGVSSDTPTGSGQSLRVEGWNLPGYDYNTYSHDYSDQSGQPAGDYLLSYDVKGHFYTTLNSQNGSLTKGHAAHWTSDSNPNANGWTHIETTVTVGAGGVDGFSFHLYDHTPTGKAAFLDNVTITPVSQTSDPGTNLFTSGDMDSGGDATTPPDGWSAEFVNGSAGTVGVSSDTPDGSAQSIELTGGETSGYDYWTQSFAYSAEGVYEGDYTLSYDWKGDIYTSLYDQNWGKLHAIWERSTEWNHWEGTITVPAGTEKLMMGLYDNSGGPGNTLNSALFDNVTLTPVSQTPDPGTPDPGTNLFSAFGDMETGGSATTPPTGWENIVPAGQPSSVVGVSSDTMDGSSQSLILTGGTDGSYDYAARANLAIEGIFGGDYTLSYDWKGDIYTSLFDQNYGKLQADWQRTTDWATFSEIVSIPDGTTTLSMTFYDNSGGPGNTLNSAQFDNLSLTPFSQPGPSGQSYSLWTYANPQGILPTHADPYQYYRSAIWQAWNEGMTGFGYWIYSYRDAWNYFGVPGVGEGGYAVVYDSTRPDTPPEVSSQELIVPSKRWEATREGVEDHAYLSMLRSAIDNSSLPPSSSLILDAENTLDSWVQTVVDNQDTDFAAQAKPDIIEAIITLTTLIDRLFDNFGSTDPAYDFDGSGTVDQADVNELVLNIMGKRFGDANLDGFVDISDVTTLIANFDPLGQNAQHSWAGADFNGDNAVDIRDFHFIFVNYAPDGYGPAAPETLENEPTAANAVTLAAHTSNASYQVSDSSVILDSTRSPNGPSRSSAPPVQYLENQSASAADVSVRSATPVSPWESNRVRFSTEPGVFESEPSMVTQDKRMLPDSSISVIHSNRLPALEPRQWRSSTNNVVMNSEPSTVMRKHRPTSDSEICHVDRVFAQLDSRLW